MSLLAACSGIYFWHETNPKSTRIRVRVRVFSNNGNDQQSELPPSQPLYNHPNLASRLPCDTPEHPLKDEVMQGGDGVPVEAAVEALGAESRGLGQDPLFINAKFQPSFAG